MHKLDAFREQSAVSIDIRVFVANDAIVKALQSGLKQEVELARSYTARSELAFQAQVGNELSLLNSRVSSLQAANAELRGLRANTLKEMATVSSSNSEAQIKALGRELEIERAANAEAIGSAAEREKWAQEQVE